MKFCDWGIIITSGKIIHDITVINEQFKFNPYIKSLCGIINCNYINTLLIDFDKNGPSKLNPFPVLDPSRISGLNLDHPIMKELLKIPQDRLDLVLQELEIDDEKRIKMCCVAFKEFFLNANIDNDDIWHICAHNQQVLKRIHDKLPQWENRLARKIAYQVNQYAKKQSLPTAKYTDGP